MTRQIRELAGEFVTGAMTLAAEAGLLAAATMGLGAAVLQVGATIIRRRLQRYTMPAE
jgi:hypothetical protein